MSHLHWLLGTVGVVCASLAAGYAVLTVIAALIWRVPRRIAPARAAAAVTLLKPLCGAEPGLYENLRSFCRQDYPEFQLVFGVRDAADSAIAIVARLRAEFPALAVDMVVDSRLHGSNFKVSNLINMLPHARHDILVVADSDAFVQPGYLRAITAPLRDLRIGLVTCVYRGVPTDNVWSRLGAMYVNEWYVPSILLSWLFGYRGYVSGQTMCLRRDTLQAAGGLHNIVNELADDHRLGQLVRGIGLQVVLSPYMVDGRHHEPGLESLVRHELRWMHTLRVLRPRSFRWIFLTFNLPLAMLGMLLASAEPAAMTLSAASCATAVGARLALHFAHRRRGDRARFADFWLLPVRDALILWVWGRTFFASRVIWRGSEFKVSADGVMHHVPRATD